MAHTLYLLVVPDPDAIPASFELHGEGRRFAPGIYCILSDLTRSRLYHRIKWQLADDAALLLAPLKDAPKFKGMDEGALSWLRALDLD